MLNDPIASYVEENAARFLAELEALVSIPSVSTLPEHRADVRRAAEFLADLVERFPKRQAIVHGYGERLVSLGRREDAEALLLKSAETATDHAAWLAIANMRLAADDVDGTVALGAGHWRLAAAMQPLLNRRR